MSIKKCKKNKIQGKVLFDISPVCDFYLGGVARCVLKLLEAIYKVEPNFPLQLYYRSLRRNPKIYPYMENYPMTALKIPRFLEGWIQKFDLIPRRSGCQIFHGTHHYIPIKEKYTRVVTIHDLFFLSQPQDGVDFAPYFGKKVPKQLATLDHIITPSKTTKEEILKYFPFYSKEKITVIPWAVDRNIFKVEKISKQNFEVPYFLSVGCNFSRKNTGNLLKAFKIAKKEGLKGKLFLVSCAPKLRKAVEKEKHIKTFMGLANEELATLYRNATALVYPSLAEGFGLPILEAQACGTPVLTSNHGTMSEVAGDGALFFDQHNVLEMAEKLVEAQNWGEERNLLQKKALQNVEKYSWEETAKKTLEVYRHLLGKNE